MKLKQKILTLVLSLCMVAACLPVVASAETAPQGLWTDYAAAAFAGGTGTKADPYQIATAEQLALLAKDVNSGVDGETHEKEYFILKNDIDLSAHVWTPIGYESWASGGGSAQSFKGYFDGNGKKITGLYVDERAGDGEHVNRNSGLFGVVVAAGSEDPVVQNLTVENGTVLTGNGDTSYDSNLMYGAGLLIGQITVWGNSVEYAVVKNCTVSGTVYSTRNAGGLVGDSNYTHFENCSANVKVSGNQRAGGFVGNAFKSEFTDCIAKGNVTSYGWCTGGFAGVLYWDTTVKHCAAFGNVEAGDWRIGGFAGFAQTNVTIANSIAAGDVKSNLSNWDPKAGGFLGEALYDKGNNNGQESEFVKLEKCHAAGKVTTAKTDGSIGGLLGSDESKNISVVGCSFDNVKNASLAGVGSNPTGTYGITAQNTAAVASGICENYYGGHDLVDKDGKKATCTEDGYEAGKECSRCGYKEGFAVIEAAGHTGGTATCTKKAVCEVCHQEYGDIEPDHHEDGLTYVEAKAATTQAEGNIEYWYCKDCGKYFANADLTEEITKADTVLPKKQEQGGGQTKTGDSGFALWGVLLLVSGSAVVVCAKKKKAQ